MLKALTVDAAQLASEIERYVAKPTQANYDNVLALLHKLNTEIPTAIKAFKAQH